MTNASHSIHVELHVVSAGFGAVGGPKELGDAPDDRASFVEDITDYVKSAQWSHSISPPYETISLVLKKPRNKIRPVTLVSGNWIVIRVGGKDKPAEAFGYISDTQVMQMANPATGATETTIEINCVGWFDLFSNASIQVGYLNRLGDTGGLFQVNDFNRWVKKVLRTSFSGSKVGVPLSEVFRQLGKIRAPDTMTNGQPRYFGDCIPVVFEESSARAFTGPPTGPRALDTGSRDQRRHADPVPGPTLTAIQSAAGGGGGQSIMSLLSGTFMGDPGLMEMFPSIEDFGDINQAQGIPHAEDGADIYNNETMQPLTGNEPENEAQLRQAEINANVASIKRAWERKSVYAIGQTLGRNPVLMYRMKPFRTEAITKYIKRRLPRAQKRLQNTVHKLFEDRTWFTGDGPTVELDSILQISFSKADDSVQTIFTADPPLTSDHPMRYMTAAGLPIIPSLRMLKARGLREYQVKWPFLPDLKTGRNKNSSYASYAFTLAALAAQFHASQNHFMEGSATLPLRLDIRHGKPVTFSMDPALGFDQNKMSAYVTRVSHSSAMSDTGFATFRTTVSFERGLNHEAFRTSPLTHIETDLILGPGKE